jgi:hypothetical protein
VDDVAITDEDTSVVIAALANDSGPDGDPLAITAHTQGAHGSVSDNGDGTLTYTPEPDFNGADAFAYTSGDGCGADTATVHVTVTAVNDAPVAGADDYATHANTPLAIDAAAGVLANDFDPEGEALGAVLVSDVAHGLLALASDGSFSYTPGPTPSATWRGTPEAPRATLRRRRSWSAPSTCRPWPRTTPTAW